MIEEALAESSHVLKESLAGIPEAEAARKPGPEGWSVVDCVEHLVIAERSLLARIVAADESEALPADPARKAFVTGAVTSRASRVQAPARAHPTGRFATLAEAIDQFDAARRDTLAFLRDYAGDLENRKVMHPLFGPVTAAEMLLIMAGHTKRHAEQIREGRADSSRASA